MAPGKVTKSKTEITREKLLDAAVDVFYERGYTGTSLNEIAQRAGVTRGAIYWHFRNKDDLFTEMCEHTHKPLKEDIRNAVSKDHPDSLEQLSAHFENIMRNLMTNEPYRKVVSVLLNKCEYTDEFHVGVRKRREFQGYWHAMTREALTNARDKGEIAPDTDIDLASRFIGFSVMGMLTQWLLTPGDFDLIDCANRIKDAVFMSVKHNPKLRL